MLVFADVFKLDAHPLEAAPVLARQHLAHSFAAVHLNVTHFTFELFLVQHEKFKDGRWGLNHSFYGVENAADDVLHTFPLSFRLVGDRDAVAKDIRCDPFDIGWSHIVAAF